MALYILQPGCQPLGQFDCKDTDLNNILGGELGTWDTGANSNTSGEKAAADVFDGYVAANIDTGDASHLRVLLRVASGSTETVDGGSGAISRPLYLLDDGKLGYGTLFGQVIGTPAGLATTGTNLGPHTAAASGKITAWAMAGLYAVSLDALGTNMIPTSGTNANLYDTPLPGTAIYREANTGKLNRTQVGTEVAVGVFVEAASNGSLVRTPARLVGASPVVDRMVFNFFGSQGGGFAAI